MKFKSRKVGSSEEMANFGDYLGDFKLKSGDQEICSKICSLPGYVGELTAVHVHTMFPDIKSKQSWDFIEH